LSAVYINQGIYYAYIVSFVDDHGNT